MPLKFPPISGQIVFCDFKGFITPEMVKKRPVIVVSPKERRHKSLCAVVPLSASAPCSNEIHTSIKIALPSEFKKREWFQKDCWAKCDIINTVCLERLDLIYLGRDTAGKRIYSYIKIEDETLNAIREIVCRSIIGKG
jgi:mRNA interferase MazF